ncbi:MAG: FlgD immunoglobulin-like domain containing protein [Candidatus Eisenbacteria bacterium]
MTRVLQYCVPFLALAFGAAAASHAATQASTEGATQAPEPIRDLYEGSGAIPLGLLFDSGTPVTDPNLVCGSCFAWSSTYFESGTDFDLTGRRFSVPTGSFASAFRLWWAYGEEGPHPNPTNLGGGPADFSSITLDLYDTSGPGGAPGALLANLTGTWTTLDAGTYYKEFLLDDPYVFTGTDYYVSLRGETAESGYGATLLWFTCAAPDAYIDYENYFNPINGTTSGWASYPTLSPCYDDLDFGLQVVGGGAPDLVSLDPEPGCINATEPCRTVDVDFERINTTPVRGVSVTFELTDLALCAGVGSITEGSYLSGHCGGSCTAFHVIDNMDGSYTVDCAILGAGCGPDSSGTLFQIEVGATVPSGSGTIEITQVIVRDCVNMPVPGLAGDVATIDIDTDAPPPVADLSTVQIKTGNGPDGRTSIQVSFTDVGAAGYEVYRAPFGDASGSAYPEYDDVGGTPPAIPNYPPPAPWTLTAVTASGELDKPPVRGYWYYAVFAKDECGNASPVSNIPRGRLDYHLGDVSNGLVAGQGNNIVLIPDISLIGANYGKVLIPNDPVNYLDVGPTDNGSVNGLPLTDNLVNFEDAILFAINYGQVSLNTQSPADTPGDFTAPPSLELAPELDGNGAVLAYELRLIGDASAVQGVHAVLDLGARVLNSGKVSAQPDRVSIESGELVTPGSVFFASYWDAYGRLVVDAAALGSGRTFAEPGTVARIRTSREASSTESMFRPLLVETSLRDTRNSVLGGSGHDQGQPSSAGDASGLTADHRGNSVENGAADDGAAGRGAADRSVPNGIDTSDGSWGAGTSVHDEPSSGIGLALLGPPEPNPFQHLTTIRFRTADATPVRLRLVDVRGRLVRDSLLDLASPGEHSITWDGTDASGRAVSSGLYFFELRSGAQSARGRIFFTR